MTSRAERTPGPGKDRVEKRRKCDISCTQKIWFVYQEIRKSKRTEVVAHGSESQDLKRRVEGKDNCVFVRQSNENEERAKHKCRYLI